MYVYCIYNVYAAWKPYIQQSFLNHFKIDISYFSL